MLKEKFISFENTKLATANLVKTGVRFRMRDSFNYLLTSPCYVKSYDNDNSPFGVFIYYLISPESIYIRKEDNKLKLFQEKEDGAILWLKDSWYLENINTIEDYVKYLMLYLQFYAFAKENTFFIVKDAFKKASFTESTLIDFYAFQDAYETIIRNTYGIPYETEKALRKELESLSIDFQKQSFDIDKFTNYYYKGIFKERRVIATYKELKNAVREMFKQFEKQV